MVKEVKVFYNNKIVGYLKEINEGKIAFQYDENWIKNGFSISPFSLPLINKVFVGNPNKFDGLFAVFYESLPDGWGELLLRRELIKNNINYDRLSPLDKLIITNGTRLGGLTYEIAKVIEYPLNNFDLDKLNEISNKFFNEEKTDDLDLLYMMGGSSAGSRPKAHIKIENIDYIIKFPCRYDVKNIGEEEYKSNLIAKKCEINVNEFFLFPSEICGGYFGAKRFDINEDGSKNHVISLSSILETSYRIPNLDYSHFFAVTQKICKDKNELYEVFKRMVFNYLYENKDDHGRNFAFIYDEKINSYKLSPFFDITKTPLKTEHEMTINGKINPSEEDMLILATRYNLDLNKCKNIIKYIKEIIKNN